MLRFKKPVDRSYSIYGTFDSRDSLTFKKHEDAFNTNIYSFCADAMTILFDVYPNVGKAILERNIKLLKAIAIQISKELVDFSPYIGADISIIYDTDATIPGFYIVLRDPENIRGSLLISYGSTLSRSYIDAQLNVVAAFLLEKKANLNNSFKPMVS